MSRTATERGRSFKFRVNGRDVFAKGANWIPANSFPSRLASSKFTGLTPAEYAHRSPREADMRVAEQIKAAADAGFNMLRVWGGGIYESEHFYQLCDRVRHPRLAGLPVWLRVLPGHGRVRRGGPQRG